MTMKTPEMEVVRFNEADVLAASGPQPAEHTYLKIAGVGTGIVGDATWTYSGTGDATEVISIKKYESDQQHGTLEGGVKYYNAGGVGITLGEIVSEKDADGLFADYNGDYETFDGGHSWKWRQ